MNDMDQTPQPHSHWPTQPWFVVQLKPNAEHIAKRNLLQQGLEIFAPFEEVTTRHARKFRQVSRPLFPGYLFISYDPTTTQWRAINSTLGVCRLVTFATDKPAQVPPSLISSLMQRCDPSGKLLPPKSLNRGDTVRITGGPFAEYVARVEEVKPQQRIWVLLDILGKNTRVAVSHADLRLAS